MQQKVLMLKIMDSLPVPGVGDFGTLVDLNNHILYVPRAVFDAAQPNARDGAPALSFIGSVMTFPTSVGNHLGWTHEEARRAAEVMCGGLVRAGLVEPSVFYTPPKRGFGARNPAGLTP